MFFDDNSQNINLKKINAIKLANKNFNHETGVICTACQRPLTDESSMIAAMGRICLERTRFAENITRDLLEHVEGPRESINKGLYPARTAILRERSEKQPRLVTILSVEPLDSVILDRMEMKLNYEKNKMTMAEAIANSLYSFMPIEAESIAAIQTPKNPEVMRDFKTFQKNLRQDLKDRTDYLRDHPFNDYYNQVSSKKTLSEAQLEAREELLNTKIVNPQKFNEGWGKGKFHRATWIARMKETQLSEAKSLSSALEINNSIRLDGVEIKDYGLTDQEILMGLQHSHQNLEKSLFKSFIEGNRNLIGLIEMYKNFNTIEIKDKMNVIKFMTKIANKENFSLGEKQQFFDAVAKLKINNKLFFI